MKAILLCGGLGIRLRSVIGEKQKAMANVKGKPFLHILIDYLKSQNINEFIFACGYKKEEIEEYFSDGHKFDIKVEYAIEKELLGTGGAIKNCLKFVLEDKVFVLNTDTLFKIEYNDLIKNMQDYNTDLSIAIKKLNKNDNNRYGNIKIKNNLIENYIEKPQENEKEEYINGGVYLIKKSMIEQIPNGKISFENDLMPRWIKENKKIGAIPFDVDFIDIGTKESFEEINK